MKESVTIIQDKTPFNWTLDIIEQIVEKLNSLSNDKPLSALFILNEQQKSMNLHKYLIKKVSQITDFTSGSIVVHESLKLKTLLKDQLSPTILNQWEFFSEVEKAWDFLNRSKSPVIIHDILPEYKNEDIYKQIINTAPAILYSCSPITPFQLQFVSDKIEEFGFERQSILQNRNFWIDHVHPDDLSDFLHAFTNCSLNQTDHIHFRFVDSHGDHRWFKNSFKYIKDDKNVSLWIGGFLQDVTSEINQRDAVREQRSFLNTILTSITEGLCGVDLDGNIIFMNPAGCAMLGYAESELIGYNLLTMGFHLKENGEMRLFKESLLYQNLQENQTKPSDSVVFWKKDRTELHVEFTASPLIRDGNRLGTVISFTDITEKRKAAAIIEEQKASVINASKLSALGEMAGGVAHEINNPLAAIQGKAYQLMRMLESNNLDIEKFKTDLKKIHETADRIAKIIRGLKAFSRNADKDPIENVTIHKLIEQALDFTRERLKIHGITLELKENESECIVQCRATQIAQVLISLINNSYDAVLSLEEKWIQIETKVLDDQLLQILVTDSGLGIKPEVAQKMMQPFFTTKGIGKGVGLGLSIANGVISEHGGRIFLDENHPHTRFIMELPLENTTLAQNKLKPRKS